MNWALLEMFLFCNSVLNYSFLRHSLSIQSAVIKVKSAECFCLQSLLVWIDYCCLHRCVSTLNDGFCTQLIDIRRLDFFDELHLWINPPHPVKWKSSVFWFFIFWFFPTAIHKSLLELLSTMEIVGWHYLSWGKDSNELQKIVMELFSKSFQKKYLYFDSTIIFWMEPKMLWKCFYSI